MAFSFKGFGMEGKLDLPEKGSEMKEPPQSQLQQRIAEDSSCEDIQWSPCWVLHQVFNVQSLIIMHNVIFCIHICNAYLPPSPCND